MTISHLTSQDNSVVTVGQFKSCHPDLLHTKLLQYWLFRYLL